MKSILYVGATLMIGASIYGFVDYKQTKKQKEFKEMYTEKKEVIPAVVTDEAETKEPVAKTETAKQTRTVATKKKLAKVEKEEEDVTVAPAKETNIVKKKKRKFGIKEFSRAPLRDDIDEEVITPEKKSSKKLEIKEKK